VGARRAKHPNRHEKGGQRAALQVFARMQIDIQNLLITNPKRDRRSRHGRAAWYPYYAGFSQSFAQSILKSAALPEGSLVLDPWNGSGTTTTAAADLRLPSVGVDLNPVMLMVAKARAVDSREKPSISPLAGDIVKKARSSSTRTLGADPLARWFKEDSVRTLRAIERAVQTLLINPDVYTPAKDIHSEDVSAIAAFFYVAIFRLVRSLLASYQASNPTWMRRSRPLELLDAAKEVLLEQFQEHVRVMAAAIEDVPDVLLSAGVISPILKLGSSLSIPISNKHVDFVLSSPPYCTRIDYAVATQAELAVMSFDESSFDALRRSLIGNATVRSTDTPPDDKWGDTCISFLAAIQRHRSRASSTYYYKNHSQYFAAMYSSLQDVSRVLADRGCCVLVVQDSHYKEIHNDLPSIVVDMCRSTGLQLRRRVDIALRRTFASINPRIQPYRVERSAVESVLCFEKET
jgi:SAM-dependent methyltransferase